MGPLSVTATPIGDAENDDLNNDMDSSCHSLSDTAVATTGALPIPPLSNIPSLVCAFTASATTGGTSYAFGLYAAALKQRLNLTQSQLNSISTAFFVAGLFTWIPGLFSDRFGTRFTLALGGCTGAASLLLYWCVALSFLNVPPEWLVVVLSALGVVTFLSCGAVTGAVFKILVAATGPGTKGSAVGAAKGYVGLGAGLYSCIFQAMRSPGASDLDFLPMAAFFFITCATIPALVLLPSKRYLESTTYQDECTGRHMFVLYGSLISMAVVIIVNSLMDLYEAESPHGGLVVADPANAPLDSVGTDSHASNYGMGMILIATWLGPIGVLQYLPRKRHTHNDGLVNTRRHAAAGADETGPSSIRRRKSGGSANQDALSPARPRAKLARTLSPKPLIKSAVQEEKRGLLMPTDAPETVEDGERPDTKQRPLEIVPRPTDIDPSMNMLQMLQTPTAWLMLWTTTILVGAGTVETNSMGQMVESLGFEPKVTAASLAFFSVSQAAARVLTGSLSEAALGWNTRLCCVENGVPRPFFLVMASLVGFVAHFTLGFAQSEIAFVIGGALAGAAFGMVWPLMVLISAEVFGVAGAGQNYMFYDGVSSAAGTLLLTKVIAQEVYEHNTSDRDSRTCLGMGCYQATHLIVAGLSLTCVLSSAAMLYTSRHVYNKSPLRGE